MISVFDVAAYILQKRQTISTWKLQKLLYYCQAWSLVWDEKPLFGEEIQAWINGPVCPAIYHKFQGQYQIDHIDCGDSRMLDENQKDSIDIVLSSYGDKSPQWLSDLTHKEMPWQKAREGLLPNVRGNSVISLESMAEYYESLTE
ncbi:MAG: DUF4065 domain-containing protein [Bacteroidetes bacterium]|nr:DUF4065 domain-containing protein [Bacteroidota bacterium]